MRLNRIVATPILEQASNATDHPLSGVIETEVPDFELPSDLSVGQIVGPSGSGKSTIINSHARWRNRLSGTPHICG